jgi:hypothetical protein
MYLPCSGPGTKRQKGASRYIDSQANSSKVLLKDYQHIPKNKTIYTTILERNPLPVLKTEVANLDIVPSHILLSNRSSTVPSRKKLKGRDNPRVDGGVALHVFDWQSVAGDRLHTGRQRDASGTQSQTGRPGRGSQHESPAILLHLGLGQCIEIANDGGP